MPPWDLAHEIDRCHDMTDQPFGVNLTFLPSFAAPPLVVIFRDDDMSEQPRPGTAAGNGVIGSRRGDHRVTGPAGQFRANRDAPPSPVQLVRDEPLARELFPLTDRLEPEPWMGCRPCLPDMVPVIGKGATLSTRPMAKPRSWERRHSAPCNQPDETGADPSVGASISR
jgi:glycine/D-amino acid oxidase-like deaminating enzyme